MSELQGQQGRVRFEACIAIAQGMVFATGSRKSNARDSDSEFSDSDTLSEDSDELSDEDHDRRKKTKPHKKNRKEQKKQREWSKEYEREFEIGRGIPVIPGYEERLEEIRKEKERFQKEKEEFQKAKEEAQKEKERAQKEKEEEPKEKEKEEARQEKELARIRIEELQRQLDEVRELKTTTTRSDQPPYQGPLGYGLAQTNLIEAGQPEWTANSDIVCYNCKGVGHYESRCWKPRVHPEVRAENIQRINAETGRRQPFQPRYGQPERRPYVPPERLLEASRQDPPQPESQLRQELEELRQQMRDMQRERQPEQDQLGQGTAQLGQGTGSNRQVLGSGRAMGREPATSNMIVTLGRPVNVGVTVISN